jgi:hypothetical protein
MKQKTQEEEFQLEDREVKFRHLSVPLKMAVIAGWIVLVIYTIAFLYGVITEIGVTG